MKLVQFVLYDEHSRHTTYELTLPSNACRDRKLAVSFQIGGGGKRSQHSRRMRNLQFYAYGKRPMALEMTGKLTLVAVLMVIYCIIISTTLTHCTIVAEKQNKCRWAIGSLTKEIGAGGEWNGSNYRSLWMAHHSQ